MHAQMHDAVVVWRISICVSIRYTMMCIFVILMKENTEKKLKGFIFSGYVVRCVLVERSQILVQWMCRWMLSPWRYNWWNCVDLSQKGDTLIVSVTVVVIRGIMGSGWWNFWASSRVFLSLYSCCVQLVAWCVMSRRVGPMNPIFRSGDWTSPMLRAYHPFSSFVARQRTISAL